MTVTVMDGLSENGPIWRKSSYSNTTGCVEIACLENHVLVRDSKNPSGPILRYSLLEWKAFLSGVTAGEFEFG